MKRKGASLAFIFITILVDVIGIAIIIPVIPTLIDNLTGEGLSKAASYGGLLIVAYGVMQFLFAPVLGELSDRYGRRPILLIALFGLGVDYVFHAYAPSLAWLFVGRFLAGMCGASITVATAYIADISTPDKRAQNFGLVGVAFGLGFIIGPGIGGFFAELWGVKAPFLMAAALTFLNFLYGLFILPESLPAEKRRAFDWKKANPVGMLLNFKKYPAIVGFVISFFIVNFAGTAVYATWTYFNMLQFGWDEGMVGLSLTIVGVVVAIVQGVLIRFVVKWLGDRKTVITGFFLWSLGLFLFAFATEGWMMFAFLIPYCLGGISGPTLQGLIANQVPDNEQGTLQGALTSLTSVTAILGPLAMTSLFYGFTNESAAFHFPGAAFFVAGVLVIVGLFFALKSLRRLGLTIKSKS